MQTRGYLLQVITQGKFIRRLEDRCSGSYGAPFGFKLEDQAMLWLLKSPRNLDQLTCWLATQILCFFYHRCRERNVYNETLRPKLLIFTFNAGAADFITSPFNINKSLPL